VRDYTETSGKLADGSNMNSKSTASANLYGITLALANMFPELMKAWQLYNKNDIAGAESAILNSSFYRNNNATVRDRLTAKANQPGVYADNLEKYILTLKQRLVATGVKVDDSTLRDIATKAFESGMDDNQVDKLVLQSGKIGAFGGSILTGIDALKAFAADYGVNYNQGYWDAQSAKLFAGETTSADIQKEIQTTAKSAFPAYAEGIDRGVSVLAQVSSKLNSMANLLEVDPDTLSLNDPRIRQAAQYVDPTTGKPAQMPDWMWENQVRRMPEWGKTNNARAKVDSLMGNALSDMGLI
jgi:hypothetical protein